MSVCAFAFPCEVRIEALEVKREAHQFANGQHRHQIRNGVHGEEVKNKDLWEAYRGYTEQTSQVARQLGLAAAGLLWALKGPAGWAGGARVGLMFVVFFFIADLLQYIVAATIWRFWARQQETRIWKEHGTLEAEYEVPWWLDKPAFTLWCLKLLLLLVAYSVLAREVL